VRIFEEKEWKIFQNNINKRRGDIFIISNYFFYDIDLKKNINIIVLCTLAYFYIEFTIFVFYYGESLGYV